MRRYIAPEVLLGGQDQFYDGAAADVWSSGAHKGDLHTLKIK